MNLSKSKYCKGVQCKKILWLDKNKPEVVSDVNNQSVLDNGTEVGELARNIFGKHLDIKFSDDLNEMINDTKSLLNINKVVITEASFLYDNNFCSVDILKKDSDSFEIYEVKSSTEVKDIYLDDISYQVYVCEGLGYKVSKACIVYVNNEYIRHGELELDKLFNIEDVTLIAKERQDKVEKKIKEIRKYMESTIEPEEFLGLQCVTPYECSYFDYCTSTLPEQNVFKIRRMRNSAKFKFYNEGIFTYQDLLKETIDEKFKQQIEFELYDKEPYIDKNAIKEFMSTLSYPLYFLDFETFQQSIPQYDGVKPYEQIPFQYSLHYIEKENGTLEHKEFLAEADIDPRRMLAERLVEDIPINICVLAYNMSFEKTVIKNLAELYPDLSDKLLNIRDNIKDLMIPFKDRSYYVKEMYGSFSIKYVLPALFPNEESLNYHNLDMVHNGSEAMSSYANLGKLSKEEQEKLRYNLLKYCELDTFAMVKIWEKLKDIK